MAAKSKVRPHLFAVDPDVPADQKGRRACLTCHLIGERGDTHHTLPDAPASDAMTRAAGERSER